MTLIVFFFFPKNVVFQLAFFARFLRKRSSKLKKLSGGRCGGLLKNGNREKKGFLFGVFNKFKLNWTVHFGTLLVFCGNEARTAFGGGGGFGLQIASNVHTKTPETVKYRDAICATFLALALPLKQFADKILDLLLVVFFWFSPPF